MAGPLCMYQEVLVVLIEPQYCVSVDVEEVLLPFLSGSSSGS